ncbi:RILP-like protein 1 [Galemys pyrenaicus]|uniref:RILP-like protein 1 n=1 Tax=Galemys pyrenaicus TaxID=202257 RepID=A0A8J6A9T6_GALPY|nr:RILP-like protein 1 [Galemys pyrenaicus]
MEEDGGSPAALSALEKNVAELTVMDVYDIASLVGHEFERVIDQHGCEAIARLMPKVVRVLEILEVLVSRHHVAPELDELRLELDRLRLERMDRIEKERKHQKVGGRLGLPTRAVGPGDRRVLRPGALEGRTGAAFTPCDLSPPQELELVEDVWRGEAQDLLSQIAQLQEENKQLLTNLSHKDVSFSEEEFQKHEGMSERERQVMKKLKEVVDKQRDEIRAKDRELGLKNEDVEALQQQQTRLMKINHDLRHRITVVEAQGKSLIEQKVELEADLQTKEQEMGSLRVELGKLRERLQGELSQNGEKEPEVEPGGDEGVSEAEKAAMDLRDPNRPRFTLQELRDVLHERNELKSKVFLLQEELAYYRSEEMEEENRIPQPPPVAHPRTSPQPESGIKRLRPGHSVCLGALSRPDASAGVAVTGPEPQECFSQGAGDLAQAVGRSAPSVGAPIRTPSQLWGCWRRGPAVALAPCLRALPPPDGCPWRRGRVGRPLGVGRGCRRMGWGRDRHAIADPGGRCAHCSRLVWFPAQDLYGHNAHGRSRTDSRRPQPAAHTTTAPPRRHRVLLVALAVPWCARCWPGRPLQPLELHGRRLSCVSWGRVGSSVLSDARGVLGLHERSLGIRGCLQ